MMSTGRFSKGAGRIALTAMFTALSLVFLYGASVTPIGQLGLVAAAGVFPAVAVVSGGSQTGWLCYAATGLLAFVLLPDKGSALLYLIFFGIYPLIKYLIEKLKKLPVEWLFKLAFCNAALALFWMFLRVLLLAELPAVFSYLWVFWLAGNAAFILYDLGFSRLIGFYLIRIHRVISKS